MVDLSVDFDDIVNENKIIIYAFCEGKLMEQVVRMHALDEMDFLQPNTRAALMLFGTDMCNLGSMTGLGNFGGFWLGTTISKK
jgi:hypothetical protein